MSDEYHYLLPEEQADELRRRAEAAKRRWKQGEVKRFWQRILADPVGRAEVWRLLDEMGAFRTDFRFSPGGQTDERATWFAHGRSTYGFEFYQQLMVVAPEAIMEMHRQCDPRFAPEPEDQESHERDDIPNPYA